MDKTTVAVERQIAAMGSEVFEVGLYLPDATGGGAVMIPRTWDRGTLIRSVPWMRLQNSRGRNIYVRPKGEHDLSLVDDLTEAAVRRMRTAGFQPAAVVETSPSNFQAWLKHPRALPKELSTAAARALAVEFGGDTGAADWRHFGRLVGFTNRKPKYAGENGLHPYVRLIETTGAAYSEGERFVAEIERRVKELAERQAATRATVKPAVEPNRTALRNIESFRANPAYGGDNTRVDLAYSIYALSHGVPETEVATQISTRDLSHKGNDKRQTEYVERTLRKAAEISPHCGSGRSR